MKKNKKDKLVNCLGWCNKQFLSEDPSTNRVCKKCKEKMGRSQNEMGRNFFNERKSVIDE